MYFKPPLPTDNLYKFMAFFGMTLIVLSLLIFYQYYQISLKIIGLESDQKLLEIKKNAVEQEISSKKKLMALDSSGFLDSEIKNEPEDFDDELKKYMTEDPNYAEIYVALALKKLGTEHLSRKDIDSIVSVYNKYPSVRKAYAEVLKEGNDTLMKLELWGGLLSNEEFKALLCGNIDYLNEVAKYQSRKNLLDEEVQFKKYLFTANIYIMPIGILLTAIGFFLWYFKLQRYQDMLVIEQVNKIKRERKLELKTNTNIGNETKDSPYSLQSIQDYIQETTEALYEGELDNEAMEKELPELHRVIEFLMNETFEEKEPEKKKVLAKLEMQARKCRECCLRRTGIRD